MRRPRCGSALPVAGEVGIGLFDVDRLGDPRRWRRRTTRPSKKESVTCLRTESHSKLSVNRLFQQSVLLCHKFQCCEQRSMGNARASLRERPPIFISETDKETLPALR